MPFQRGFEHRVGPLYVRADAEPARIGFRVAENHLNPNGTLHGGMLMTLTDDAVAVAALRALGSTARFATVSLNCDFLSSGSLDDWIEAEAEIVRRTRQFFFVRIMVSCEGRLMATASGLWRLFAGDAGTARTTPAR